jgi:hypothetical protein
MQFMGLAHYGTGYSFHSVYEFTIGATGFSNFRDSGGAQLGNGKTNYDLSFAIGYGVGFGITSTTDIEVVQEIGTLLHEKTGLSASANNYPRVLVTRIGGKFAF